MSNYHSFSNEAVQNAIDTAKNHYSGQVKTLSESISSDSGHLSLLAECIELTIESGKACLKLPLGIGDVCVPVPDIFDAKLAQACLHICSILGIPTGVKVTVSVAGVEVASQTFGKCN